MHEVHRLLVPLAALLACLGCETETGSPIDCTRMICAGDSGGGGSDAGTGVDANTPGADAGSAADSGTPTSDAGSMHDAGHAGHDAGSSCGGEAVTVTAEARFCTSACYCRHPEQCLPIGSAPSCCHDDILCPVGGDENRAGCRPFAAVNTGDGLACEHGFCLCSGDDECYAQRSAEACCDGTVTCF